MFDFSGIMGSISNGFESLGSSFTSGIENFIPSFGSSSSDNDSSSIWSNFTNNCDMGFGSSNIFGNSLFGMPDIFSYNPMFAPFGGNFSLDGMFNSFANSFTNPFANFGTQNNVKAEDATVVKNINENFKGELANAGELIVSIANDYNIDPSLFAAILANESGWGEQASGYNFGGLMDSNGLQNFGSLEEGLKAVANTISKYYEEGKTTPETIGPEYCPVGCANDDGGNSNWIGAVSQIQSTLSR